MIGEGKGGKVRGLVRGAGLNSLSLGMGGGGGLVRVIF